MHLMVNAKLTGRRQFSNLTTSTSWKMGKIPLCFPFIVFYVCVDLFVNAEYDFKVYSVDNCPLSKEDWDKRSNNLTCNGPHGYHCVPNVNRTSLIEFCYKRDVGVTVEAGYCLELAGQGFLNQVLCKSFSSGCPSGNFYSQDLYKYPKCLAINTELGCFDADVKCVLERTQESRQTSKKSTPTTQNDKTLHIIIAMLAAVIVAFLIGGIVFYFRRTCKEHIEHVINGAPERLRHKDGTSHIAKDRKDKRTGVPYLFEDDQETINIFTDGSLSEDDDNDSLSIDRERDEQDTDLDLHKLHDALARNDEKECHYLLGNFNSNSLNEFNKEGFNSLHLSARGGNLKLFRRILESNIDINTKTVDGRNCLHIAAFNGSFPICKYILDKHKLLFYEKDRNNMNPAHWAALGGQESILQLMKTVDSKVISAKTEKYKENIVLFACIGQSVAVCEFVKNCEEEEIAELLGAKNSEGWNAIQYAAKSGNFEVFEFLVENKLDIRNKSIQTEKHCLHTACEKGNKRICEYIFEKAPDLIKELDKHEQHVGHFAAKSGNKEILQFLMDNTENDFLAQGTSQNINILHIACRHAWYDMCEAIVKLFPHLVNEITEKGWNAALFITEKAGAEKDRVKILRLLEKENLNVYHVSRSGKTILYNACVTRSVRLVRYLLKNYPGLSNIEKSIDAAKSEEIEHIFRDHYKNIREKSA